MAYKFLKCKNPTVNHIKLAFGILLEEWKKYSSSAKHHVSHGSYRKVLKANYL